MSITQRTNIALNPESATTTNYAAVAGTGGTASLANNTTPASVPFTEITHTNKVTWTVATSAVSGGASYTHGSGISAATQYSHQVWVKPSKLQTMNVKVDYRNASNTIVNTLTGSNTSCPAGVWTQLKVQAATSGAAVTNLVLTAQATTGGSNWANGDTLEITAVDPELGAVCNPYFSGNTVSANNVVYSWQGTADNSGSTAFTYLPVITVTGYTDESPCPRASIAITDLWNGNSTINLWETADGVRRSVTGALGIVIVGSTLVWDYAVPLGRTVQYDVEVLDGVNANAVIPSGTVTVNPGWGYIQDPLVPGSAIALHGDVTADGTPALTAAAFAQLEYAAGISILPILGSPDPIAILSQRLSAANVPITFTTLAASKTTALRNLIKQTPLLLIRGLPAWGDRIPTLFYAGNAKAVEKPVNVNWGGSITEWELTSDTVAAPTLNVLVPIFTYGDVEAIWATYQQAQTAFAAKTYLYALQFPSG